MKRLLSSGHGLALLRIAFGVYFLSSAYEKTAHHWLSDGQPLAKTLRQALSRSQPGYRHFLRGRCFRTPACLLSSRQLVSG